MKELSIEEKAQRYDEAIKIAKDSFNYPSYPGFIRADVVFPELKESEDERIRKALVDTFKFYDPTMNSPYLLGIDKKDVLAWLEKQGKNNMGISEATKKKLEDNLNKALEKETPESCNEFLDEQKPAEYEKPLLEKFKHAVYDCAWGKVTCKEEGETKEEYANRWAEQFLLIVRDWADDHIDFTIKQKLRNSYEKGKTDIIEKQGEQKPVPKFKVGDTMRTLQEATDGYTDGVPVVVSIDEEYYHCNNELIAIKDQDDYEYPPMNRRQKSTDKVEPKFKVGDIIYMPSNSSCPVHSSTDNTLCTVIEVLDEHYILDTIEGKIQESFAWQDYYELVEQKLADTEKGAKGNDREIPNSVWSEEDEARFESCIKVLQTSDGYDTINAKWLKSLKDRVQPQQQEWSEEDKRKIDRIYFILRIASDTHAFSTTCRLIGDKECVELQDFLKSLRPQNRWKPSDEQIEAVRIAAEIGTANNSWAMDVLKSMYQDLKKLREE